MIAVCLPSLSLLWMLAACTPQVVTNPDATDSNTSAESSSPTNTDSAENTDDESASSDGDSDSSDADTDASGGADSGAGGSGDDDSGDDDAEDPEDPEDPVEPEIVCNSYDSFPTGVTIDSNLLDVPDPYEPSGITWNAVTQKLFLVSDEGIATQMNADGTAVFDWDLSGDYEGITFADPASDFVYIGLEKTNDSILELNIETGLITRTFNLSTWMDVDSTDVNLGLEALTFVPDASHAEGGTFWAGLQETGEIFIFSLPIVSSTTSTTVTHVRTFLPSTGRTQISDLFYNEIDDSVYALYRGTMTQLTTAGVFVDEWSVPGSAQEGLAIDSATCTVYIAQDSGAVYSYDF